MARVLIAFFALLLVAAPVSPKSRHDAAAMSGHFDYYVLTLSCSPVYCGNHPQDQQQCGAKRYGFVLHGLWPQYTNGGYPQRCATQARLTEASRRFGRSVFPSEKLVAHEWDQHGTCSGMEAMQYFKAADDARRSIKLPARLEPGSRTWETTARDVSKAIREVNPRITQRGLALQCSGPELAELRICLDKGLQPVACGSGVRDNCRSAGIRVLGAR